MTKKQYSLMLILALVAGLVGGVVSSQFLVGQPAFAEKKSKPQKVIEAQEFRLVNKNGKLRAFLKMLDYPHNSGGVLLQLESANQSNFIRLSVDNTGGDLLIQTKKNFATLIASQEEIEKGITLAPERVELNLGDQVAFSGLSAPMVQTSLAIYSKIPSLQFFGYDKDGTGQELRRLRASLTLDDEGEPSFRLLGKYGNSSTLGSIELVKSPSDVIERRPASSLVLIGKKGNVIWQAP